MKAIIITMNKYSENSLSMYDYYSTLKSFQTFFEFHSKNDWKAIFLSNIPIDENFKEAFERSGILFKDSDPYIRMAIEKYNLKGKKVENNWFIGLLGLPFMILDLLTEYESVLTIENDVFFNHILDKTEGNVFYATLKTKFSDSWLVTAKKLNNFYVEYNKKEAFNSSHLLFVVDNKESTKKMINTFIDINLQLVEDGVFSYKNTRDFYEYFGNIISLASFITKANIQFSAEIDSWSHIERKKFLESNWHRNLTIYTKEFLPEKTLDYKLLNKKLKNEMDSLTKCKKIEECINNRLIRSFDHRFIVVERLISLKNENDIVYQYDLKMLDFFWRDQKSIIEELKRNKVNKKIISALKKKTKEKKKEYKLYYGK